MTVENMSFDEFLASQGFTQQQEGTQEHIVDEDIFAPSTNSDEPKEVAQTELSIDDFWGASTTEDPKVEDTKVEEVKTEEQKAEEPKVEEVKAEEPVEKPKAKRTRTTKKKETQPKEEKPKPTTEDYKVDIQPVQEEKTQVDPEILNTLESTMESMFRRVIVKVLRELADEMDKR